MKFEKVLEVFAEHLREDTDCEVIRTRHGYTLLIWDNTAQDWETCEHCPTPEALMDGLAGAYEDYMELKLTGGKRELLSEERAKILMDCNRLKMMCD